MLSLKCVIATFLICATQFISSEPLLRTCEPIRVDTCSGLGYNMTGMPNFGGNEAQIEADYSLKSFAPLIQYGCSPHLKLFLCSVYVPMCTDKVANPIGPCRGLCESVRSRCYPVLQGFGFPWPDALNCSRFPEKNNYEHMCMEGPIEKIIDVRAPVDPAVRKFDCGPQYVRTPNGCVPMCDSNLLFDESEKKFAEVWTTVWALICLVISLSAVLTLTIGGGRVKAHPLVSLALCYCLVSAGWTLRMFAGRMSTSCQKSAVISGDAPEDGLSNVNCAFVFLLIYYFGMAANAWWVCLCGWWLARVGLNWSPERLRGLSSVLHLFAWGFPAAQTVAALVRRDVDSDELTATCYIGNRNDSTLLSLVLIPYILYFSCGTILLTFGFSCILKRPARPLAAAPLTSTAPRKESDFLGAICALYAAATFYVTASLYYEYVNRSDWLAGTKRPALWSFLLRHFMSLFVGVSAIFWIWSMKTVTAWKAVLRRLGPRKQPPTKVQAMPVLRYVPKSSVGSSRHAQTHSHGSNKSRRGHEARGLTSEMVV